MLINIAVYTAVESYKWQSRSVYTDEELDEFLMGIHRFPREYAEYHPYARFFINNGKLVFARFFKADGISKGGRSAEYVVLGTVGVSAAEKVDFSCLLEMQEFAVPHVPFPVSLEYNGPESASGFILEECCKEKRFAGIDVLQSIGRCARSAKELWVDVVKDGKMFYSTVTFSPQAMLSLSDRMMMPKVLLDGMFNLFSAIGLDHIMAHCNGMHSKDFLPPNDVQIELRKAFDKARQRAKCADETEKECRKLEDNLRDVSVRLRKSIDDWRQSTERANKVEKECQRLRSQLDDAKSECQKLDKELCTVNTKLRESIDDGHRHAERANKVEMECQRLRSQLGEAKSECQKLDNDLCAVNAKLRKSIDDVHRHAERADKAERECQSLRSQLENIPMVREWGNDKSGNVNRDCCNCEKPIEKSQSELRYGNKIPVSPRLAPDNDDDIVLKRKRRNLGMDLFQMTIVFCVCLILAALLIFIFMGDGNAQDGLHEPSESVQQ